LTKLVGLLLLAQDALSYDTLPLCQFPSFQQCLVMCGHPGWLCIDCQVYCPLPRINRPLTRIRCFRYII
jgi:hypothetical protein